MENKKIGTLIKAYVTKRKVAENTEYDAVLLIYRDEKGEKKSIFHDRAEIPFYIIKDKTSVESSAPPMFIEADKVEKSMIYSDLLYRELAMKTDALYYYDRVLTTWGKNDSNMKNLFKHNWLYDTDMDIADRYIAKFHEEYAPNEKYKLHKCYFDIEVDLMPDGFKKDSRGHIGYIGFPDEEIAPCPVNIITLYDEKTRVVHSFIHKNKLNESIMKLESGLDEFKTYISDKLSSEDGIVLNSTDVSFYNSEEETIEAFFKKVHNIDPDFMLAWNMVFDVNTLINRLKKLYSKKQDIKDRNGNAYDEALTVISDPKYMLQYDPTGKIAYLPPKAYYIARKNVSFTDRTDSFYVMDAINWMDQLLYYANIRKTGGQKESYSLDAVSYEELGKEKLEFGPGETMKTLPWTNFKKFAEYNIRDVVLLHLLEVKNLDMDMIQRLSEVTNTRKEKVFKKTISLKNFVNKYANENGFIMSNNKNAKYGDDSDFFDKNFLGKGKVIETDPRYAELLEQQENFGAYVADPNLNSNENGIMMNGRSSKFLFENVFDEDFSSLYPSIIRAYNLDKNTQVGKFFLVDDETKAKLISKYDYDGLFAVSKNIEADSEGDSSTDDLGPTFIDSLMSFDFARVGEKYFNLPSTEELAKKLKKNRGES
jgi:DNA polymerase elongation subunit (family B)